MIHIDDYALRETSLPSIKSMDNNNSVVSLGTVSKILSPGLRIGWAIGDEEIIRRMAIQKSDGGTSPFNQRICNSLMRSNKLAEHIQELTNTMMVHRDEMIRSRGIFTNLIKSRWGTFFGIALGMFMGGVAKQLLLVSRDQPLDGFVSRKKIPEF